MNLTGWEIGVAYYCLADYRRKKAESGERLKPSFIALYERFDHVVRFGEVSPSRHESITATEELGHVELIGTRLAAEILGWNLRRVQRHAADLDGRTVGGRLVFPAEAVKAYRDAIQGGAQ